MNVIKRNKVDLIDWLSAQPDYILQHAHSKSILTDREYNELKHLSRPEQKVIDLLDLIMGKTEELCHQFLDILKKDNVKATYPQLKEWERKAEEPRSVSFYQSVQAEGGSNVIAPCIMSSKMQGTNMGINIQTTLPSNYGKRNYPSCNSAKPYYSGKHQVYSTIAASDGSYVVSPIIHGSEITGMVNMPITINQTRTNSCQPILSVPLGSQNGPALSIEDKGKFLKTHQYDLVQKVKNVNPITDQISNVLHPEAVAIIRTQRTPQDKMRKILEHTQSKKQAEEVFKALLEHEPHVMEDILTT